MRLGRPCRLLLLALVLESTAAAHAQSADRAARVDEIVASAARVGFPHLIDDAVPAGLRYAVHEELPKLGRARQLGADWKPGNAWYARASEAADRAGDLLAQQAIAQRADWEKPLRAALDPLQDGELESLAQICRSPAGPVLLALADAGVSLFILATLETQRRALGLRAVAMPVMQRLSDRIVERAASLNADQRAALAQHAPRQALKTLAVVYEAVFRNIMRGLQPDIDGARERLRADLEPLLEQFDPLGVPPPEAQ